MNRIFTFFCFLIFSSCAKEILINNNPPINDRFFSRNKGISNGLIKSNSVGSFVNTDIVDTIISELKELDIDNKFSKKIENLFGLPKWNYYLKVNNNNKFNSVFIPVVDSSNKINMLIFAYQNDLHQTVYKFVNRNTVQSKIRKFGDPNATLFTQQTLDGVYKYLESKVKNDSIIGDTNSEIIKSNSINSKNIKANEYYIFYTCWSYNWAYSDENGTVYVGATIPQCTITISMTNETASDIIGDPYFQNGSTTNLPPIIINDPCLQAKKGIVKSNSLSENIKFISAKSLIIEASNDGNEHTITLYKSPEGEILKTPISTNNSPYFCVPNTSNSNSIADLHSHPNSGRPSEGDLYNIIDLAGRSTGYDTRYILFPDGEVYALLVHDYNKASTFVSKYKYQSNSDNTKNGTFPIELTNKMLDIHDDLVRQNFSNSDADLYSFSKILEEYDVGVSLLKQGNDGKFFKMIINSNNNIYSIFTCP